MMTPDFDELDAWLEQAEDRLHKAAGDMQRAVRRAALLATLAFAGLVALALLGVHPAAVARPKNHHTTRPLSPPVGSQEGSQPTRRPRA